MNFLKRLASDTMWYGMSSIISRIVMFVILTPYVVRITDIEEYGVYGLMYAFAAMLIPLFTFRMETAFFRFGSKRKMDTVLWTGLIFILFTSIIVSFIILSNDHIFAQFLTKAGDERFIWYIVIITLFDALSSLPYAYLRLDHRPKKFAFYKILNILITVGLVFLMIEGAEPLGFKQFLLSFINQFSGFVSPESQFLTHDQAVIDYLIIANIGASSISLLILSPIYFKNKFSLDVPLLKKMIRYSAPLVIVGIAAIINQITDRILIKQWMPGTNTENIVSAGIYSGATRLAVIMSLFTQAYNYAAEPFFFKSSDESNAKEIYARSAESFFLFGFVGYLLISLNLCWIKYYLTESYWEGLKIVPILLMSYLILGLYYNFSIWYKVSDKTKYGALISVIGAIITIALNYILIPHIGLIGAAITSLSVYVIMCLLSLYYGRKHYPISYKYHRFIYPIIIYFVLSFYFFYFEEFAFNLSWKTIFINLILFTISTAILLYSEKGLVMVLFDRLKKKGKSLS